MAPERCPTLMPAPDDRRHRPLPILRPRRPRPVGPLAIGAGAAMRPAGGSGSAGGACGREREPSRPLVYHLRRAIVYISRRGYFGHGAAEARPTSGRPSPVRAVRCIWPRRPPSSSSRRLPSPAEPIAATGRLQGHARSSGARRRRWRARGRRQVRRARPGPLWAVDGVSDDFDVQGQRVVELDGECGEQRTEGPESVADGGDPARVGFPGPAGRHRGILRAQGEVGSAPSWTSPFTPTRVPRSAAAHPVRPDRDYQRARVYAWEDRVVAPRDRSILPYPAAQSVVSAIWADIGLRFPPTVAMLPVKASRLLRTIGPGSLTGVAA